MTKYVYMFNEGNANMRNLLGGKGANLAEMTGLGLPVPRGFTVTTEACTRYYDDGRTIADDVKNQIFEAIEALEKKTGKIFGDPQNPLLVSVRSGSRASMPGMMDTILNLGLTDAVVEGLAELTDNPRFAYDSYRRLITMFGDVVKGIEKEKFDEQMDAVKAEKGITLDTDLTTDDLKEITKRFKKVYEDHMGEGFPQDPQVQLMESTDAVFRSWNNERAIYYRRMNNIPGDWGTAVNIQEMVYGNMGETSGTGVAFTRDPATGENVLYGEYLMNAQGEDVVAGLRTPETIDHLKDIMPEVYEEFCGMAEVLEKHYGDMQDMEFTIERGKLFMLQTRNGKRTAKSALKIAVDMVAEGLVTKQKHSSRLILHSLTHCSIRHSIRMRSARQLGLPEGYRRHRVAHVDVSASRQKMLSLRTLTVDVILVRNETSPEDIQG